MTAVSYLPLAIRSVYSGVYYSRGGSTAVPIVFLDPRGHPPMLTAYRDNDDEPLPPFHNQFSFFAADAGDMVRTHDLVCCPFGQLF